MECVERAAEVFGFRGAGEIWVSGGVWGRPDNLLIAVDAVSRWSRLLFLRGRRRGSQRWKNWRWMGSRRRSRRRLLLGLVTRSLLGSGLAWCRGLLVAPTAARPDRHSDRDGAVEAACQ